ncbi:MAG: hypothetical protein IJY84_06565 [Clostridia bacterium]|nr:hypothetical protein [Clostridia bacterium]
MRIKKIIACILRCITAFLSVGCTGDGKGNKSEAKIKLLTPSDGENLSLNHPEVENLLLSKTESDVALCLSAKA